MYLEDTAGDLQGLIGSEILLAEEVDNYDAGDPSEYSESYTWTFYKLSTIKESVTLRWLGESNGYYAEDVDFFRITDKMSLRP